MVKKVTVNIPDERYKGLVSLSESCDQNVKDVIVSILEVVGLHAKTIENLSKEYKVPVKLRAVIHHTFDAGFSSLHSLFNEILEKLDVKGFYVISDFEVDLNEDYMLFSYDALVGCDLKIESFYLTLERGGATLTTNSYIEVGKVNNKALEKLKNLVQNLETPECFQGLDDYEIEIEEDEEFWTFRIHCQAESLFYLTSVTEISKFVQQIFKKAGIK